MSTNTELIAEARRYSAGDLYPGAQLLHEIATVLEAAEAELTRRDTIIAAIQPREIATDALTGFAPGADIARDDVWQLIVWLVEYLAAGAPVPLEAAKAETNIDEKWLPVEVTEWRPVEAEGGNRG